MKPSYSSKCGTEGSVEENLDGGLSMLTRIISGVVLLPILIVIVAYGGLPLKISLICAAMIGLHEFYRAFSKENKPVYIAGYIFGFIYLVFMDTIINASNVFNIFVSAFMVVILSCTVIFHHKINVEDALAACFGLFYVCFLMSHIWLIRDFTYGAYFIWLVFISAFGCDTGAYFTGRFLGKHKLCVDLSPKKTVEGAIGGVITAVIISVIYGIIIERYFVFEGVNTILVCTLTGFIGSILSQLGDLAASAVKRYKGIKDYGNLIPGHGGILDRFDSVLFTSPVVYYVMFFLIEVR